MREFVGISEASDIRIGFGGGVGGLGELGTGERIT
jgi:hypothetical protein